MPLNTQPIPLTPGQLSQITADGAAAALLVQATPAAVGAYAQMYNDIAALVPATNSQQLFWFQEAQFVNADTPSQAAAFFIRDMTSLGLQQDGYLLATSSGARVICRASIQVLRP